MPGRLPVVIALVLSLTGAATAQNAPPAAASPFRPLELPAPNQLRTGSGRPGRAYWQQRADYRIEATLDTDPPRAPGPGDDSLHEPHARCAALSLAVPRAEHLRPRQRHQPARPAAARLPGLDLRFLLQGLHGRPDTGSGPHRRQRTSRPRSTARRCGSTSRVRWRPGRFARSRARLALPRARLRGGTDGPRRHAVRDRASGIRGWRSTTTSAGWNHEPYIGGGEFYLEYGSFDVALTVPASYIVGATGVLLNPEQVLTPVQRARLARARHSTSRSPSSPRMRPATPARTRPA